MSNHKKGKADAVYYPKKEWRLQMEFDKRDSPFYIFSNIASGENDLLASLIIGHEKDDEDVEVTAEVMLRFKLDKLFANRYNSTFVMHIKTTSEVPEELKAGRFILTMDHYLTAPVPPEMLASDEDVNAA